MKHWPWFVAALAVAAIAVAGIVNKMSKCGPSEYVIDGECRAVEGPKDINPDYDRRFLQRIEAAKYWEENTRHSARVERVTVLVLGGFCEPDEVEVLTSPPVMQKLREVGFTLVECGEDVRIQVR